MNFPLSLTWFHNLSIFLKIVCIVGVSIMMALAWPVAVAGIFGLIVLSNLQDRKAAALLVAGMALPALIVEGVWLNGFIEGMMVKPSQVASQNVSTQTSSGTIFQEQVRGAQSSSGATAIRVSAALSGDELQVNRNGETMVVRLIGVEAPNFVVDNPSQSACFGVESQMFLHSLLRDQLISIEEDRAWSGAVNAGDGVVGGYVTMQDGTNVNELMLKAGLVSAINDVGYKEQLNYAELATIAQQANKGLWASCNPDGTPKVSAGQNSGNNGDNTTRSPVTSPSPTPQSTYTQPTSIPTVRP